MTQPPCHSRPPTVSVIVPCYNRADLIGEAVETVRRQSLQDWELIVVDDGSADGLYGALQPYRDDRRIRYLRHPHNRGVAAARNTGVTAARGRFVAFLDSDDLWVETKLERQLEAVLAKPDPDGVFCVTQTVVQLSGAAYCIRPERGPGPRSTFAEFLYNDGGFAQSSSFFLSATLARNVPFREDLLTMEDHMFFVEIGAAGAEYVLVREPLVVWRNDEARTDRISRRRDIPGGRLMFDRFRQHLAACAPPRALIACEARFRSGRLWSTPGKSVALLLRAYRSGALSIRQVVALSCRNALPRRTYDAMRFWRELLHRRARMSRSFAKSSRR